MNYFIQQDSIYIGDIVNFIIELDLESGQVPVFPEIESTDESFSIGNKIVGENFVEYELTFWQTGKGKIPQIPIQILENNQIQFTLETDSIDVKIFSLLKNNEINIRDIKGMQNVELISTFEKLVFISVIIIGVLLAIYFWRKRSRKEYKKSKKRKRYFEPIHIQTVKALERIEIEYPINWVNAEKFYLNLTFIFRKYLTEEFYFKALEMTTNEIIEYFVKRKFFMGDITSDITELLNRADLSKYAKQVPDKEYFIADKEKAIFLVKSLHKKLEKSTNGQS